MGRDCVHDSDNYTWGILRLLEEWQRRLAATRDGRAVHVQDHRDEPVVAVDGDQVPTPCSPNLSTAALKRASLTACLLCSSYEKS